MTEIHRDDRLKGKVAIVTGAGSRAEDIGNGRATAVILARHGARVTLVDTVAQWAEETKRLIEAESGVCQIVEGDVSDPGSCQAIVARTAEAWGRLEILVNNVGITGPRGNAVEVDVAAWDSAMRVNVVAGDEPFAVKQPDAATTWMAGSNQTVTWAIAKTSSEPINCGNVRVLLSIDGGRSFPFILASSTPNNGTATISVPNAPTSTARVKVEAIGNIFFSISLPNFTIAPNGTLAPTLLTEANTNRAIALDSVTFMRDPFPLTGLFTFGLDQRTRVILFATGLGLLPGEDTSVVTGQVEDSAHRIFPLTIEHVGKVSNFDWLTQVNVRLPNELANAGEVLVSVKLHGATSNKVLIGVR